MWGGAQAMLLAACAHFQWRHTGGNHETGEAPSMHRTSAQCFCAVLSLSAFSVNRPHLLGKARFFYLHGANVPLWRHTFDGIVPFIAGQETDRISHQKVKVWIRKRWDAKPSEIQMDSSTTFEGNLEYLWLISVENRHVIRTWMLIAEMNHLTSVLFSFAYQIYHPWF